MSDVASAGKMMKRNSKGKELSSMRISKSDNGGFAIEHAFKSDRPGEYHEPETHVFGEGNGKEVLAHVSEHLGIQTADDAKQVEEDGDGGF